MIKKNEVWKTPGTLEKKESLESSAEHLGGSTRKSPGIATTLKELAKLPKQADGKVLLLSG